MFMSTVVGDRVGLTVHLYKHRDTRRYLNLDDRGRAYCYCGSTPSEVGRSIGWYRRYSSVVKAIEHLELHLFDADNPLYRSFPPEEWPRDELAS